MKRPVLFLLLAGLLLGQSSCKDNATDTPETGGNYVLISTNDDGSGFAKIFSDIPTGTVDNATGGFQLKNAYGGQQYKSWLFIQNSIIGEPGIQKLEIGSNGQVKDGGFIASGSNNYVVDEQTGYYLDFNRGAMKLQKFNPSSMTRTGEIDLTSYSRGHKMESVGQRIMVARDGKLFVDLYYSEKDGSFGTDVYDSVEFLVIDIATNAVEAHRVYAGASHPGYYMTAMPMFSIDENGDIYFIALGDVFATVRDSRILRIKKGSTDFDRTWELDMDNYSPNSFFCNMIAYKGKIFSLQPIEPLKTDFSNFSGNDNFKWTAIDIVTKQVADVAGVPVDNFDPRIIPVVLDGKIYATVTNTTTSAYYAIDPATNSGVEQFKLQGGIPNGFYNLK